MINFAVTGTLLLLCYLFARSIIGLFTKDVVATEIALQTCCTSCCGAR